MFEHLDYVYMPSADVAADVAWFSDVLGGRVDLRDRGHGDARGDGRADGGPAADPPGRPPRGRRARARLPGRRPGCGDRPSSKRGDGSAATRWRSRRDRCARSPPRAASGWRCTSSRALAWRRASSAGAISEPVGPPRLGHRTAHREISRDRRNDLRGSCSSSCRSRSTSPSSSSAGPSTTRTSCARSPTRSCAASPPVAPGSSCAGRPC